MYSSISSDEHFKKKKNNYTVPLPTEIKNSQVTRSPSQTAAKAEEQKKKTPFNCLLSRGEAGESGKDPVRHEFTLPQSRCLRAQRTSAAQQQCEQCNNLQIFFSFPYFKSDFFVTGSSSKF